MSEVLTDVKHELGSDAIIVATRTIRRGLLGTGVEISAATDTVAATETSSSTSKTRSSDP